MYRVADGIRVLASYPVGWGLGWSALFVGSLYVWKDSRNFARRDEPVVIKKRLASVALVCAAGAAITPLSFWEQGVYVSPWNAVSGVSRSLFLVGLLFLGPIVQRVLDWHDTEDEIRWSDISTWRNLVAAPVAEEYIFRSCTVPLFIGSGWSLWATVFLAPWTFSVAHLHHYFRTQRWLPTVFQMAYTALFGAMSTYLFLRTGNVYGPIAAHALCNYMGFPDFPAALRHRLKAFILPAYLFGLVGFIAATPRLFL